MRLPQGELEAGCNLAAISWILNIVSGLSVSFFLCIGKIGLDTNGDRGSRFKALLSRYYPWQPIDICDVPDILWKYLRNPLSHSLGILEGRKLKALGGKDVTVRKKPLSPEEIAGLETSDEVPDFLKTGLTQGGTMVLPGSMPPEAGLKHIGIQVSVPTLYWGLYRLMYSLFGDEFQMKQVEDWYTKNWEKVVG